MLAEFALAPSPIVPTKRLSSLPTILEQASLTPPVQTVILPSVALDVL
jgi:hypothetical protein